MTNGRQMFRDGDLREYLSRSLRNLSRLVEHRYQGPREDLTDQQFAEGIAREAVTAPLEVDFDNPIKNAEPVTASGYGPRVVNVSLRGTYSFGFTGDPAMVWQKPSTWLSSSPYGDVEGDRIVIGVEGNDPEQIKGELERQVNLLKQYVSYNQRQVRQHNEDLAQHILPLIEERRRHIKRMSQLKDIL